MTDTKVKVNPFAFYFANICTPPILAGGGADRFKTEHERLRNNYSGTHQDDKYLFDVEIQLKRQRGNESKQSITLGLYNGGAFV